jgi:hypothetical protein
MSGINQVLYHLHFQQKVDILHLFSLMNPIDIPKSRVEKWCFKYLIRSLCRLKLDPIDSRFNE